MEKQVICPHCNKDSIVKRGSYQTAVKGKIQRFYCKKCDKKFIIRDGFYRMRNSPEKITLCIDLYFKGVSTRKVQEHLQTFYPRNSTWVSIYNWLIKYSNMVGSFTDTLKINTSKSIQVDEMEFFTKGKPTWFIDTIDPESKFMVSSSFFNRRGINEIKEVLNLAKSKDSNINHVTSDGFHAYKYSVKRTFYSNYRAFTHKIVTASKGEGFNHPIERLHNTIRERTKIMRGFHGSVESARALMKGIEINYNFNRKHQTINCCPYELVTDLRLDRNKWLDLINLSFE